MLHTQTLLRLDPLLLRAPSAFNAKVTKSLTSLKSEFKETFGRKNTLNIKLFSMTVFLTLLHQFQGIQNF